MILGYTLGKAPYAYIFLYIFKFFFNRNVKCMKSNILLLVSLYFCDFWVLVLCAQKLPDEQEKLYLRTLILTRSCFRLIEQYISLYHCSIMNQRTMHDPFERLYDEQHYKSTSNLRSKYIKFVAKD